MGIYIGHGLCVDRKGLQEIILTPLMEGYIIQVLKWKMLPALLDTVIKEIILILILLFTITSRAFQMEAGIH